MAQYKFGFYADSAITLTTVQYLQYVDIALTAVQYLPCFMLVDGLFTPISNHVYVIYKSWPGSVYQ